MTPRPRRLDRPAWMADANCRGQTHIMYGDDERAAYRICLDCPVTRQCLDYALDRHEHHGIWGGHNPDQRETERRRRRRTGSSMTTTIEWTDETWNPVTGCDRVSAGCDNCYALNLARRLKAMGNPRYQNDGDPRTSGPGFGVTVHPDKLNDPLRWRTPRRVFVNSMSDLFHPDVPDAFIESVFDVMLQTPHTFQVLTKRPQRMARWVTRFLAPALLPTVLENIHLGTSIENDRYAWRADHLRATPAAVRFLSLEPLLGPLPSLDLTGIDCVIVGGESGHGARPMHPDWARDIRDRCVAAGVPFFFKQWGEWRPLAGNECSFAGDEFYPDRYDGPMARRVGKKAAGRELDGRTWDEMPA